MHIIFLIYFMKLTHYIFLLKVLDHDDRFSNIFRSIVKTAAMMVGELNFDEVLYPSTTEEQINTSFAEVYL